MEKQSIKSRHIKFFPSHVDTELTDMKELLSQPIIQIGFDDFLCHQKLLCKSNVIPDFLESIFLEQVQFPFQFFWIKLENRNCECIIGSSHKKEI